MGALAEALAGAAPQESKEEGNVDEALFSVKDMEEDVCEGNDWKEHFSRREEPPHHIPRRSDVCRRFLDYEGPAYRLRQLPTKILRAAQVVPISYLYMHTVNLHVYGY